MGLRVLTVLLTLVRRVGKAGWVCPRISETEWLCHSLCREARVPWGGGALREEQPVTGPQLPATRGCLNHKSTACPQARPWEQQGVASRPGRPGELISRSNVQAGTFPVLQERSEPVPCPHPCLLQQPRAAWSRALSAGHGG